jgi:glycerol uptake facilitator-like aquaporin
MAERLASGNAAVALLANTFATVAVLAALIGLFAPISGAHFNPAVSLTLALRANLRWSDAIAFVIVQVVGCCAGAIIAHAMFELPLLQWSQHSRSGAAQFLSEFVATAGLILIVLGHRSSKDAPWMVAAWIGAAYWFTASTSFANPAITIARALTNTFSGIRPQDVAPFIVGQLLGAGVALIASHWLFADRSTAEPARAEQSSTYSHDRV